MNTDIEFAQAAIDMLPGSVEEIERFLREQGIRNRKCKPSEYRPETCPVARWVKKWTDTDNVGVSWLYVRVDSNTGIDLPDSVMEFVVYADSK